MVVGNRSVDTKVEADEIAVETVIVSSVDIQPVEQGCPHACLHRSYPLGTHRRNVKIIKCIAVASAHKIAERLYRKQVLEAVEIADQNSAAHVVEKILVAERRVADSRAERQAEDGIGVVGIHCRGSRTEQRIEILVFVEAHRSINLQFGANLHNGPPVETKFRIADDAPVGIEQDGPARIRHKLPKVGARDYIQICHSTSAGQVIKAVLTMHMRQGRLVVKASATLRIRQTTGDAVELILEALRTRLEKICRIGEWIGRQRVGRCLGMRVVQQCLNVFLT